MRVAVTGGLGRIGAAVLADLAAAGHEVRCVDTAPARGRGADYRRADLRELWQALDAIDGAQAVVHLAGVGVPDTRTAHRRLAEQATFAANVTAAYNVFQAAVAAGARRVVWATSETVLGPPFRLAPPSALPLDDESPVVPETSYAVSKAVGEDLARHVARQTGISVVGLRYSVVMDDADYAELAGYWADPLLGRWNLWSYIDLRDVVRSCRLALSAQVSGAVSALAAATDTLARLPTAHLAATYFPGVPLTRPMGAHESLLDSRRARDLLGFAAEHSWRDAAHPAPAGL